MTNEKIIENLKLIRKNYNKYDFTHALDCAIEAIEHQPEETEWLPHTMDRWVYAKCSVCGYVANTKTKYCPDCGRKAKEANNEQS